MGEKTLVDDQINDSISVIKTFDAEGNSLTSAFWYLYQDAEEWRFIIASDAFDQQISKNEHLAYKMVAEAVNKANISSISISDIKVMRRDDPLIKTIKFLIGTGPNGITRAHFSNTTINGIFIKEMVILRSS